MKIHKLPEIAALCGGVDRLLELAQADHDKRIAILPFPIGSTVYSVQEDFEHGCLRGCPHWDKEHGRCGQENAHCPVMVASRVVEGYTIKGDEQGRPVVSAPGEWGCEGLETGDYVGVDQKTYTSEAEAEKAKRELEAQDNG